MSQIIKHREKHTKESLLGLIVFLIPILLAPVKIFNGLKLQTVITGTILFLFIVFYFYWTIRKRYYIQIIGLIFILPLIITASGGIVFHDIFYPGTEIMTFAKNLLPDNSHVFGTDYKGRDILNTIFIGGQSTYIIALIATVFSAIFGLFLGVLLAIGQKLVQGIAEFIVEILEAFPRLFFLLIIVGILNVWIDAVDYHPDLSLRLNVVGVLVGLTTIPFLARLVQRLVENIYTQDFVLSLRVSAVSEYKILFYNVLYKNVLPHIVIQISFVFGLVVLIDSSFEYIISIGFGDFGKGGYLSWGKILADARHSAIFGENLWIILPPIIGIVTAIIGANLTGDGIAKNIVLHEGGVDS